MNGCGIGVGMITLAMVGVAVIHLLGRGSRLRRKIARARQWAIRDWPPRQLGRVAGMVVPIGRPLIAPLTGRACVYYRTRVEHTTLGGTGLETTTKLLVQTEIMPFAIDDGTGYALVDVRHTEVLVGEDVNQTRTGAREMTPEQLALLERHEVSTRGVIFNRDLTFIETIIEVGERIAAVGVCMPERARGAEPMANDPYRQMTWEPEKSRARLMAPLGAKVLLTDEQKFAPPQDEGL